MPGDKKNANAILFIYEGDTEFEFYKKIFEKYIPIRKIKFEYYNLNGIYSIDNKVYKRILYVLTEKKEIEKLSVFVAYDRDGPRTKNSRFNLNKIRTSEKIKNEKRLLQITEIIATRDIESWFMKDIDGIYKFLKVPKSKRSKKYKYTESYNNKELSRLFHQNGKHYQKGSRVEGFIDHLDIDKIYKATPELIEFVKKINELIT